MKVLLDVTIILDVFLNRQSASKELLNKAVYGAFTPYITANMLTDIYYILTKQGLDAKPPLEKLCQIVEILEVKKDDCLLALSLDMADYEDALVVAVAKRHQIDLLVTRNEVDFAKSQLIVYSPDDFLARLNRH